MLTLRVLGPIEASQDGEELNLGGPRQRRLLCSLIADAGRVVSVERLAEQLWSDEDRPAGFNQTLRSYVARLRRSLKDASSVIVTTPPGYALICGNHEIDAKLAQELLDEALLLNEHDPEAAIGLLVRAADLWRGAADGEFADLDWLVAESQRLGELQRSIVEALFDARLRNGGTGELVAEPERATADYPLSERLRGQLMMALVRSGRAADAARSFQSYRKYLAEETGLEPGLELKELEADIVNGKYVAEAPARASLPSIPSGTVTFLFTDIEGSTALWATEPDAMAASLRTYGEVLRAGIRAHNGYVFTAAGDAFCAAFYTVADAVAAALGTQASLALVPWDGPELKVRMGLHLGEAEERGGNYFGPVVNTIARVQAAGHGGQVLITEAVRLATEHPVNIDFGTQRLRGIAEAVKLYQLNDGDFPPLRVVPENRSTLPIPATSLIGREDEIRQARTLLLDHRLVTLTGVGGCGKTRLAIEVAEQELTHFEHGTYFADLSVVHDDEGVLLAVAEAVQLSVSGHSPLDQVVEHLAGKKALVVLDNCEHVIDACATFAAHVLGQSGQWRMLVTSREFLDVPGERVLQVPSLSSSHGGPGPRLFEARAVELVSDFVIDEANQETISALCGHLDGMPMAIELAAARIGVMSPAEILDRIEDRFRVLSGGRRRTRHRQRTLEAALDWSYELLDPFEKALLDAMGVFRGPFDARAIAAVAHVDIDDATDLVESLIAKSLVETVSGRDRTLYRLLETVRGYAEEHLRQSSSLEATRHQHLDHYVAAISEIAAAAMAKHRMQTAWGWMETQRWLRMKPNLDAAIDWAIACDRDDDAAVLLGAANPVWREQYAMQPVLDRLQTVARSLPDRSELRDQLRIPEITLLLGTQPGFPRLRQVCAQASQSTNAEVRYVGRTVMALTSIVPNPARRCDSAMRRAPTLTPSDCGPKSGRTFTCLQASTTTPSCCCNHTLTKTSQYPISSSHRSLRFC